MNQASVMIPVASLFSREHLELQKYFKVLDYCLFVTNVFVFEKVKNATVQNPLDQVILVRLSEGSWFLKSNIIEETLPLSIGLGNPHF